MSTPSKNRRSKFRWKPFCVSPKTSKSMSSHANATESKQKVTPEAMSAQSLRKDPSGGQASRPTAQTAQKRPKEISFAARQRGPGPAYSLPSTVGYQSHDIRRPRMPAYSISTRYAYPHDMDRSPGPIYALAPNYTVRGREPLPRISMTPRREDTELKSLSNRAPGPGAYCPENNPYPGSQRAPAYTLVGRRNSHSRYEGPSPDKYTLPGMIGPRIPNKGAAPAFTILGKGHGPRFDTDLAATPGPAGYGSPDYNVHKRRAPAYSMVSRNFLPDGKEDSPGPKYRPDAHRACCRRAPAYSMGIRHTDFVMPLMV